jgi:hypothetical protein
MEYNNPLIENLMQKLKQKIGSDYYRYKNHVYRVYQNCIMIDSGKDNEEKYAIAAVFHDIGIWTDHTFDYLNPSAEQAKIYLTEINKTELIEEITTMINWHHKISSYKGEYETLVENFRKADWIDVTFGLMTFGLDKQKIKEARMKLPDLGFHTFLVKESVKNFLRHPLNPLPMFKR